MWIAELNLKASVKEIILKQNMLNDTHINAAQVLLGQQFPRLEGLQSTLLCQTQFQPLKTSGFIAHGM